MILDHPRSALITIQTDASLEESSAAAEELSSSGEEIVASVSALGDMATVLIPAVDRFKLSDDDSDQLAA